MPRQTADQLRNRKFRRDLVAEAGKRMKADGASSINLDDEMNAFIALMPHGHILPHDRPMLHTYLLLRRMYFEMLDKLMKGQNSEPMRATAVLLGAEAREFAKLLGLHKIKTSTGKVADLLSDAKDPKRRMEDIEMEAGERLEKLTSGEPVEVGGKPGRGNGKRSMLGLTLDD